MNIIKEADNIVNKRSEEKERMYGPFEEGMQRAAQILSGMSGLKITTDLMYKAMIALKLSRQSYHHKEDNLLDAIAYMGSLNDHLNKLNNNELSNNKRKLSSKDKHLVASIRGGNSKPVSSIGKRKKSKSN